MNRSHLCAAAAVALFPLSAAYAQAASPTVPSARPDAATAPDDDDAPSAVTSKAQDDRDDDVVVTGHRRTSPDVLGDVSVLDDEEMTHDMKPSLGDLLADMPGVSATSFGPSASRPILRGEQGDRASVLVDGISSLDLSASDPDHAVAINPLTAQRIEVLHGPGALIYAPSPIGGVVDVIDKRIPRSMPDGPVDLDMMLNYGSAANERSGNLGVDVPLGKHFVVHADGAYSKYDDLHVGGHLLSDPFRKQALASPDPAIRALADLKDTLPNTAGRSDDVAAGAAYVDGDVNVGVSVSRHDTKYGVPIRFSLDPAVPPERPTIDAHQTRADARAEIPIGGIFSAFDFRGGLSKYHHAELNAQGQVGSRFGSNGGEMRADLVQSERGGWGGTSGVDYLSQDARIRGDEKYLPDSRKRNVGLFTLQTMEAGKVRFEAGARLDSTRLNAEQDPQIAALVDRLGASDVVGSSPVTRHFSGKSASVGANYEFLPGWRAGLSVSHSERAPAIDELFSFGPHGGSEQFLMGNPNLALEKSNGAELSVNRTTGPIHLQGSLYYSRYSNFIFQAPTGAIDDGLPVYQYREGKARYYGFELESEVKFGKALGIDWGGEVTTDTVRAKIDGYGNAPEIPPFRILAGLSGTRGRITARVEAEKVTSQNQIAPNETRTPGFMTVNSSVDWHPVADKPDLTLSLTGNNLFDVNARRHASDLKDFAPLAGRDIRLSARLGF